MQLSGIIPLDFSDTSGKTLAALLRALIMRVNFAPGPRHVVGWRGLCDCSRSGRTAFTAKIKNRAGVFGLELDEVAACRSGTLGSVRLNYFPHPDEDLLEQVSVSAGIVAARPGYMERVRRFAEHEDMRALFNIAVLRLGHQADGSGLWLELEGPTRQQVVAVDGVSLPTANGPVALVPPGGLDQDFPAWETALDLFKVLAASATVALGGAPVMAREANGPATRVRYGKSGNDSREPAPDLATRRLRLAWGREPGNPSHDLDGFQESLFWQEGEPVPGHMADELFFTAQHMGDFKSVDKTILGVDDRPQFIVLTGFLGSGKTTFLKHFLEYQEQMNRFAAVIQNEIGETGLDGKILDREFAVTEIDEGCVCCSLSGNVKVAVSQIMESFHPDVIVLETTGLANPANLLDEMEELDELIRFDSVTCVVDAASVEDCLREYKVAREQIASADIILLNKADLAGEKSLSHLEHVIGGINPKAPLVRAVNADVNPALLYGADPLETRPRTTRELPAGLDAHPHTHAHDGLESVKIDLPDPLDKDELIKRLGGLPSTVFRVKGVVQLLGHETPAVLQYVAGRFELSEHRAQQAVDPFLVFIGQGLGQTDWAAYLAGCDQQALEAR